MLLNAGFVRFVRGSLLLVVLLVSDRVLAQATPPNDRCDHVLVRTLSMGASMEFTGTTSGATALDDALPGNSISDSGLPSVWHGFSLSSCSRVTVAYCGTAPAYSGYWGYLAQGCPAATLITATSFADDACADGNRTLVFDGLAEGTYYLPVLNDVFGTADGPYRIVVSAAVCTGGTPPNDLCGAVTPVPIAIGGEHTFMGDNTGATSSNDGAVGTIIGSMAVPTVWHAFVLDHCASVVVDYCGTTTQQSNYWNVLATGCPAGITFNPTQVLDDECGNGNRTLFYAALDPGVYYVPVLYDPFAGAEGPYQVRVKVGVCFGGTPPNDLCATAIPKPLQLGVPARFEGDNRGATTTSDGPPGSLIGDSGLGTVWHAFSIDRCARITVDYCGSEAALTNYWDLLVPGCDAQTTIAPVTFSDVDCNDGRRTLFYGDLEAGTYHLPILLDDFSGSSGRYELNVLAMNCADEVPENDRCVDVTVVPLADPSVQFLGNNTGATAVEDGVPGGLVDASGLPTVWHAFSTTTCKDVRITYCGTSPVLANYWNLLFTACPSGDPVFPSDVNDALCSEGERTLLFDALPAGTYYVPVLMDEFSQSIGPYVITVSGTECELPTSLAERTPKTLKAHPVPASAFLRLTGLEERAVQVVAMDVSGRMVRSWSESVGGQDVVLDVADMPSGRYLFIVEQDGFRQGIGVAIVH